MKVDASPHELIAHLNEREQDWWVRAAKERIAEGFYRTISERNGDGDIYLLRVWLSPPQRSLHDKHWSAYSSVMLHFFFRGDDDHALHDHPMEFTTHILSGGYLEHLPPTWWLDKYRNLGSSVVTGPPWDERVVWRLAGDTVHHSADSLHCVGQVEPGTVSLVTTGFKEREWGFHPEGKPWVDSDTYLDEG